VACRGRHRTLLCVSSMRESVEQASLPALRRLSSLPRVVPFLAVLALMVAGLLIPTWGWVFLAVVLLFLSWMLYLGWPRLTLPERMFRVAVLTIATAVTLTQVFPQG
jgi:hypothetical protein